MATLPRQIQNITDPGLGTSGKAERGVLVMGVASTGTVDQVRSFSVKQDMIDVFGQGPMPEDACRILDIAGGPVHVMRLTATTAGAAGSVSKTATASGTGTITVAGAPFDSYLVKVQITKAGVLGAGEFKYSLDYTVIAQSPTANNEGRTFSADIIIPASGTFPIPNTNLTLTFVPGSGSPTMFDLGDFHRFDCTAPLYQTTDLSSGITALLLTNTDLATIVLPGEHATSSDAATMFGAFGTHLTSLESQFRYVRGIMDGGSLEDDRAAAITDHLSSQSTRISLCYGYADITSAKPITGWGTIRRSYVGLVAARTASDKVSTDSARVASGAIPGVVDIRTNEERSPLLNPQDFTTMRTWQGEPGFYITNNNLRSASGSDFRFWQHGAVMDVLLSTVIRVQAGFVKRGIRTNPDGTINEVDALKMESDVQSAIKAALLDPKNEEGTRGHISDFGYSIDRTNNVLTTETIRTTTKARPLGYPSIIETDTGFSQATG